MIKHIYLEREGLGLFLGSIEEKIMLSLWSRPKTMSEIHNALLNDGESYAYPTINTVTRRLVQKGLVKPVNRKQAKTLYTPVVTEGEFLRLSFEKIAKVLSDNYPVKLEY